MYFLVVYYLCKAFSHLNAFTAQSFSLSNMNSTELYRKQSVVLVFSSKK